MKKIVLVLMTLVLAGTGIAVANSLGVPWYVDNADRGVGLTPPAGGIGIVYLKNNQAEDMLATIRYYNSVGIDLGPNFPNNTFEIPANSTVGFRPFANDPASSAGGQESAVAVEVPNRPQTIDTKKNGSIVIQWIGQGTDVQGQITQWFRPADGGDIFSYSHLLPAGV